MSSERRSWRKTMKCYQKLLCLALLTTYLIATAFQVPLLFRRKLPRRSNVLGPRMVASSASGAVIVGGGPSGMATALMLAKRGWKDITVLEKSPSADHYDPNLAFVYQIDRRGQYFTDDHGLTEKLARVSVDTREFKLVRVPADGDIEELSLPIIDNSRPTAYWLPRSVFQELLYEKVCKYPDQIKIIFNSSCDKMERVPDGTGIKIRASVKGRDGETITFRPKLVVGADGLKSTVRKTLQEWDSSRSGKKSGKGRFEMRKMPSGSSGLRYKVLTLPAGFKLDASGEGRAQSHKAYAILSRYTDAKRTIRIGVLPWGPLNGERENTPRGGNFITLPGHPLWDVDTVEKVKEYLKKAFPQVNLAEDVREEELSRFASSQGGRFPDPQYCPGLYELVEQDSNAAREGQPTGDGAVGAGVVLIGDAIHAFPPDLGQGVNSALEDVLVLDKALETCQDDIKRALPEYERLRAPDSKALVRLCQVGYPWQYKQPAPVQSKLWAFNFALRSFILNKFLPAIFDPPAFMMIQTSYDQQYRSILRRANRTTRRIVFTAASIVLAVIFRRQVAAAVGSAGATVLARISRQA